MALDGLLVPGYAIADRLTNHGHPALDLQGLGEDRIPPVGVLHVTHPAFREIETLFDNGVMRALGIEPRWPAAGRYNAAKHAGFKNDAHFGPFEPEPAAPDDPTPLTRGMACRMVWESLAKPRP